MKNAVGIAVLVLVAFTAGWWIGRTTARDVAAEGRLAALEAKVTKLEQSGPARPPEQRAEQRGLDPEKVYTVSIENAPAKGPANAAVTIIEFSDFECPFCRRVTPTLNELMEKFPSQVRLVWKHFPLAFHRNALPAHKATVAAGKQGKFWEMHDLVFSLEDGPNEEAVKGFVEKLGLDKAQFEKDMNSPEVAKQVADDQEEGRRLGVSGTPSFFINGRYISGAQPYEVFEQRVKEELQKKG